MVYIEQYNTTRAFITTLSNATIAELKDEQGLPVSRFHGEGNDPQHWIAEPSALAALREYSETNGHLFQQIKTC